MKRIISILLLLCMCAGLAYAEPADVSGAEAGSENQPAANETAASTTEPTVTPTVTPEVTPTVEPSVSPSTEPSVEPSETPTATPAPSGDCWLLDESGARVERGSLTEILRRVGKLSVEVSTRETVVLRDFPLMHLSEDHADAGSG